MKPLKLIIILALLALASAGAFYLGTTSTHQSPESATENTASSKEKTLYTCGMHPNVIQDKPGLCPICEMKLTPIRRGGGGDHGPGKEGRIKYYKSTMIPGEVRQEPGKDSMGMEMVPVYESEAAMDAAISIDPVTIQNMGIRTVVLTNGPLRRVIRTVGALEHSETGLADVTTKFRGWIEKLYVDTTGSHVRRGDPLFEIYSPELYSAQTEFLLALKSSNATRADTQTLLNTARTKLRFWDISDEQINHIEQTGKPLKTLQVESPIDGYVMDKMVVEGQMVEPGMRLYRIANHDVIWVESAIYEQDIAGVEIGDAATVTVTAHPGRSFEGRVSFIHPTLDERTRAARVRVELPNPEHELLPGMFANVELTKSVSASGLLIPETAVLRGGSGNTVFVALDGGKFEPRTVTLGARAEDDQLHVLGGLKAGERAVVSGQFMLDSESQLREAIQKMLNPSAPQAAAAQPTSGDDSPLPALYTCPMESHAHVVSDQPGKCPECGMKMVDSTTVEHGRTAEAAWRSQHQNPQQP